MGLILPPNGNGFLLVQTEETATKTWRKLYLFCQGESFCQNLLLLLLALCSRTSLIHRMYLEVEEITKILKHYKGENIATIPLGKEKNLDGIGNA